MTNPTESPEHLPLMADDLTSSPQRPRRRPQIFLRTPTRRPEVEPEMETISETRLQPPKRAIPHSPLMDLRHEHLPGGDPYISKPYSSSTPPNLSPYQPSPDLFADHSEYSGLTATMTEDGVPGHRRYNGKRYSVGRSYLDHRKSMAPRSGWLDNPWKDHVVAMIAEFLGTTLFLFFAFAGVETAKLNMTAGANLSLLQIFFIAAGFGTSLFVNVFIFFRISGGQFNPAVTLALTIVKAVPPARAVLLVVAQLAGGCLAALLAKTVYPNKADVANSLGSNTTHAEGYFIESFTTFLLIFTILFLAVEKHRATFLAPVGIGAALFIGHMISIPFTGAGMNPARTFGPAVVKRKFTGDHWIYWAGPLTGAVVAVLFYKVFKFLEYEMTNPGQDGDPDNDPTQDHELLIAQRMGSSELRERKLGHKRNKSTGSEYQDMPRPSLSRRTDLEAQWAR